MVRLCLCLLLVPFLSKGQVGGRHSFDFTNIPSNTRVAGLGGVNISLADVDVNMAFSNPALSGDTLAGLTSFNYSNYLADAAVFSGIYQRNISKLGSFFFGVTHVSYGDFDTYDNTGQMLGEATAGDTEVMVGKSHQVGVFRIGATVKFMNSTIAGYTASAIATDIGGVFIHPDRSLTAALAFKNVGVVIRDYTDGEDASLPLDVQIGVSFKPQYMPFRFSLTGYNLAERDIPYNATASDDEPGSADRLLRHVNVGAELLLSQNLNVRFGYNHLRRQELKLDENGGGAGFTFGFMFRVKAFEFSYSRGGYHAAGGSNVFGITVNTNKFLRKTISG